MHFKTFALNTLTLAASLVSAAPIKPNPKDALNVVATNNPLDVVATKSSETIQSNKRGFESCQQACSGVSEYWENLACQASCEADVALTGIPIFTNKRDVAQNGANLPWNNFPFGPGPVIPSNGIKSNKRDAVDCSQYCAPYSGFQGFACEAACTAGVLLFGPPILPFISKRDLIIPPDVQQALNGLTPVELQAIQQAANQVKQFVSNIKSAVPPQSGKVKRDWLDFLENEARGFACTAVCATQGENLPCNLACNWVANQIN